MNITEIVFGDSLYYTMSKSKLSDNNLIKFNTLFSIADLSLIDQFKIILPSEIYNEDIIYDFSEEIQKLNASINTKNKIRVWCSYQDSDSYILLTYISNYLKNKDCDLYVVYSDEKNKEIVSPSILSEHELEQIVENEHKLTKKEMILLTNLWNIICSEKEDMRIMDNKLIKLVSFDYFDNIILDKLQKIGEVKIVRLVGLMMSDYHIADTIFLYLIERLIKLDKIVIVENDERLWNSIIKVKNNE